MKVYVIECCCRRIPEKVDKQGPTLYSAGELTTVSSYRWPQQSWIPTVAVSFIILAFVRPLFYLQWEKSPTAILPASLSLAHIKERNATGLALKSNVCHSHLRDRVSDDRGDTTSDVYMKWFMSLDFDEGGKRHVGSETLSEDQGECLRWEVKIFLFSFILFY